MSVLPLIWLPRPRQYAFQPGSKTYGRKWQTIRPEKDTHSRIFLQNFCYLPFLGEQLRQSGDDIVFCGFTDSKVTEDTESTGVLCYASI